MSAKSGLDIYDRMSRNRIRLATAIAVITIAVMGVSCLAILLLRKTQNVETDFWLLWVLFWMLCLLYVVLRYAVGWRWVMRSVSTTWKSERQLKSALLSASLVSGMLDRIHLYEIPDDDINSFSLSLPDGTYALFLTRGMSSKVPESVRVAMVSHEIAHMQAGDTAIYTLMIRLAGPRTIRKMVGGLPGTRNKTGQVITSLLIAFAAFIIFYTILSTRDLSSAALFWVLYAALILALMASLPTAISALLKVLLDRNREYLADLHAAYLTRDPESVYQSVKLAAEDVRDVILLPACFDALLFHPVVDYSSYRPFRTQPTMAQRISHLHDAFPMITV
jgi:Zn-dependent protease with chaperone function